MQGGGVNCFPLLPLFPRPKQSLLSKVPTGKELPSPFPPSRLIGQYDFVVAGLQLKMLFEYYNKMSRIFVPCRTNFANRNSAMVLMVNTILRCSENGKFPGLYVNFPGRNLKNLTLPLPAFMCFCIFTWMEIKKASCPSSCLFSSTVELIVIQVWWMVP